MPFDFSQRLGRGVGVLTFPLVGLTLFIANYVGSFMFQLIYIYMIHYNRYDIR